MRIDSVTAWVRRVHIWAGLFVFAQLVVYGVAGSVASLQPGPERAKLAHTITHQPYTPPPSATDKEVAASVYRQLRLPLTRPVPEWFLQHTPSGELQLDFYNINGIFRVIVLEKQGRLRIEHIRNSLGIFLSDIHAATLSDDEAAGLVRAWAIYNEAGIWTLLAFCVSGLYLWMATRPRDVWAWLMLCAGAAAFMAVYFGVR